MFIGVPLVPFMVITTGFLLAAGWTLYLLNAYVTLFLLLVYAPLLLTLQAVTRKDDQRLRQLYMRLKMRTRHSYSRRMWSAFSYSPVVYKKRKAL